MQPRVPYATCSTQPEDWRFRAFQPFPSNPRASQHARLCPRLCSLCLTKGSRRAGSPWWCTVPARPGGGPRSRTGPTTPPEGLWPARARAALADGPDVWEVIRDLQRQPGRGDERIRDLANQTGLPVRSVRLAADFYHAFTDEINARIEADERAAEEFRRSAEQKEAILSP